MKYVTRAGGATVTVFVPFDCGNHCPFCINKAEYADMTGYSTDKIIESMKLMDSITPNCDFVFTGGEPLANLEELQRMLDVIPNTHKVFINTTLPTKVYSPKELADFLNKNKEAGKITGINVSRHLLKYVAEDDSVFELLKFEPRVNCVLYTELPNMESRLRSFVNRFRDFTSHIQFRKDYTVTTVDNLYDTENDEIYQVLKRAFGKITPFDCYRMRCGYEMDYEDYRVTYHKTLPYSKIDLGNDTYALYDIIIKQNGVIKEDWDTVTESGSRVCDNLAKELDIEAYKQVTFEEYK